MVPSVVDVKRTLSYALAFLALSVAGCAAPRETEPGPTATAPPPPVYAPDCTIRTPDWADVCTARASQSEGHKTEIWTAVDPQDPNRVAIGSKDLRTESSRNCVWNGLAVTADGGGTWTDVVIGGRFADRSPPSPYYGFACNTDPMMQFGRDGSLYYLVELYNLGAEDASGPTGENRFHVGWRYVLARSDDGGYTWPVETILANSLGMAAVIDYSRIAISATTGTIVTAWSTFSDFSAYQGQDPYAAVMVVATRQRGTQPDPPVLLAPRTDGVPNFGIGDVAAAPDGSFTLLFDPEGYGTPGDTYISRSTDDGRTWTEPTKAFHVEDLTARYLNNTRVRTSSHFELAYGPEGTLYTVYAANDTGDADAFFRSSPDDGRTWSDAQRINGDLHRHAQWHPNIIVSPDGILHVLFFDRRYDPADRLVDITYAESQDGGSTWVEHRVTSISFDADLGRHQFGFPFIGDYLGIDASGSTVWLGFPITITGTSVIAAARFVK